MQPKLPQDERYEQRPDGTIRRVPTADAARAEHLYSPAAAR